MITQFNSLNQSLHVIKISKIVDIYILTITHKHEGLQVSMDQRFSVIHNILNIFLIMIMFSLFSPKNSAISSLWSENSYTTFLTEKIVINKKGNFHHLS